MSGPPRCLAKPRGASQCAGVLTPRVVDVLDIRPSQFLPWEGLRPLWRRLRGGCRTFDVAPLGGVLGHFFSIFSQFFRFLGASEIIMAFFGVVFRFFSIFDRFWMVWGRILGRFWGDFSMFFRCFLKTANFVKYSVLPRKNQCFFKVGS